MDFQTVLVCFVIFVAFLINNNESKNLKKFVPRYEYRKCLDSSGLCNDTSNYPKKEINRMVKRKKYMSLFSSVIEPAEDLTVPKLRETENDKNLCRTKRVTIFPKTAYDFNSNELRFIVNVKDFEQSLTYETCVDVNKQCFDNEVLPFGFQTVCKQKHNVVRLVSVTKVGKLEYGKFLVPSTCVCSYYDFSV